MFKKPAVKKLSARKITAAAALAKKIHDERPERKHVYTLPKITPWHA